MDSTAELRGDLEELESLLRISKRPAVIRILSEHCQRLRENLQEVNKPASLRETETKLFGCAEVCLTLQGFFLLYFFTCLPVHGSAASYVQLERLTKCATQAASPAEVCAAVLPC